MREDATSHLLGTDNRYEDLVVGDVFRHARGKTITSFDNVFLTHLVMNTAQGHFNEHIMEHTEFGTRITFGGIVASVVLGLASQDTGEHAIAEIGLPSIRFRTPVVHGDTLYTYTKVIDKQPPSEHSAGVFAGVVRLKHWGVNQRDDVVAEIEREVLVRCGAPPANVATP